MVCDLQIISFSQYLFAIGNPVLQYRIVNFAQRSRKMYEGDQFVDYEAIAGELQRTIDDLQTELVETPVGTPADHECELDKRAHIMPLLQVAEAALLVIRFNQIDYLMRLTAVFGPDIIPAMAEVTPNHFGTIFTRAKTLLEEMRDNPDRQAPNFPEQKKGGISDIGEIRWIDPSKKGGKRYTN
jgi:hypothetical protein